MRRMTDPWDEEFAPTAGTRSMLRWAYALGATTLGEAQDLLDHLAVSNDVPEVLGQDDTLEEVGEDLALGIELIGPDAAITDLF